MKIIAASALLIFSTAAAVAQSNCEQFGQAIELSVKEIAFLEYSGAFDNSAARETNRRLDKLLQSNLIHSNLLLMQTSKCPLPKAPLNPAAYSEPALKCTIATSKAERESNKDPIPACDRATWKPAK